MFRFLLNCFLMNIIYVQNLYTAHFKTCLYSWIFENRVSENLQVLHLEISFNLLNRRHVQKSKFRDGPSNFFSVSFLFHLFACLFVCFFASF